MLLLGLAGCDRGPQAETAVPSAGAFPAVILGKPIEEGGRTSYVGSASCRECHVDEHRSWTDSFHRTMTQAATREAVKADFNGAVLETESERFTLGRQGDEHWVAIEDLDELRALPPGATPSPPVRVRLSLVTGSHHMQVFWMPAGFGNAQIGFPFTWLIEDARWAPRSSVFIRDPAAPAPVETWNMTCIRCHTTAGQPRPRPAEQIFETRVAEHGISCEACHGPGEEHARVMREFAAARSADPARPKPADLAIAQPAKLTHERSGQVCGQCHSMKWFDRHENWEEEGFRYRPGDDLEATTPVIRPAHVERQPWIQQVLQRHPTLFDDFFWSDGMIRVAGREWNGLLETACTQRGEMSCLSCHSMHEYTAPADQLRAGRETDGACTQCHAPDRYAVSSHTRHLPTSEGSRCYNCHMPHTTYALLKAVRQHQIDSPRVSQTLQTGRPNACNLCHLDQSLGWTAQHLRAWYGQEEPPLTEDQREVSAAAQDLLAGDAGQRALWAWHFGWEPARRISGTDWMAPLLGRLLDDPYPAVRYIAHRSFKAGSPASVQAYDFVGSPESRAAIARAVGQGATAVEGDTSRRRRLLHTEAGQPDQDRIEERVRQRNNRPVHLRE